MQVERIVDVSDVISITFTITYQHCGLQTIGSDLEETKKEKK